MGTNILEQRMLEDTLGVFRDNTYWSVTEAQGVMLIDGWLQALEKNGNVEPIRTALTALRKELNNSSPDRNQVKSLLNQLADHAQAFAQAPTSEGVWTGSLQQMSVVLRQFSEQI